MRRTAIVQTRVTPEALRVLDERCEREEKTRSEVIRDLIESKSATGDRVWVAHYDDMSEVVIFATEIAALRHAVKHDMLVTPVLYGHGLNETLNTLRNPQR